MPDLVPLFVPRFAEIDLVTGGILAALTVGGLLIGFLLLYWRFARIENLLSRLQEIHTLSEEIRGLKQTMSELSFREIEHELGGIRDLNERLVRVMEAVYQESAELNARFGRRRGGTIRDAIERRFYNQGYTSVEVLADLDDLDDEAAKVPVEVVRSGVTYKGYVVVRDGAVAEASVKPPYEVFP